MTDEDTRTRRSADDIAFLSYLGTLATLLLIGGCGVLVLDLEGKTKLASAAAFLLPALALLAVIGYVVSTPDQRD
jgi:hypothetical protein